MRGEEIFLAIAGALAVVCAVAFPFVYLRIMRRERARQELNVAKSIVGVPCEVLHVWRDGKLVFDAKRDAQTSPESRENGGGK
jgi:hypothetical protein